MDLPFKVSKAVKITFGWLLISIEVIIICALIGIGVFPWLGVIRAANDRLGYVSEEKWQEILPQVVQGFYVIVAVVLISSVVIYHYARTPDFMERTKKTISTTLFDILKFVIPFQVAGFFLGLLIQF